MHEVTIAEGLIRMLEDETKRHGASRIKEVNVRVGELSNCVPDALMFAFETSTVGTVAEGAKLNIEYVPARGRCERCDLVFEVESAIFLCPQCNQIAGEIVSGKELDLVDFDAE
jgi:hydrogenase nickel incorporation protein HypA/HybF